MEILHTIWNLIQVFWPELCLALALYVWLFSSPDDENAKLKTVFRKTNIFWSSVGFMLYSKDTKGLGPKYNPNSDAIKGRPSSVKKIIFIRHGESDWNNVFNKGINFSLFNRMFSALFEELKMLFVMDSKFLDSPLNFEGIEQALELRRFLESRDHPECSDKTRELIEVLRGETGTSIVCASTLRRALATTTLGLWPRLCRNHEKIHVLSSLQEISRNVDTTALARAKEVPDLPFQRVAPHCTHIGGPGASAGEEFNPANVYDVTHNQGNKTRSMYGIKRLRAFTEWAFNRKEEYIIVGGHSLWFKHFFQTYLPHNCAHEAMKKKITNSGVVAFELHQVEEKDPDGQSLYRIDPESIVVVYGGFTSS